MDLYKMSTTFIALLVVITFPCETFQFVVRRHHPYKRIPDVCQKVHCDTPPPSKYKNCHLFTEKNKQLKETLGIYIDCCPIYQCNNVADGKNVLYIGTSLDQHANETKIPRTIPRQVIMSNLPRPVTTTPTRRSVSTTTTTTTPNPVTTTTITTPSPVTTMTTSMTPSPVTTTTTPNPVTTTTSTTPSPVTTTTTPSPVITTVITTTTTIPSPVTMITTTTLDPVTPLSTTSTTTTSTPLSTTESDEDSPELETTTRSFRNFGRRLKIEEPTTASSKPTTENIEESTELPKSTTESEYSEDYSPELETTTRHFRNFGRRLKIDEPETTTITLAPTTTSKPPIKATPLFTPAMLQELKKQVHPVRLQMQSFNGNQKCTYLVTTKDGKKSCITIQDA